MNDLKDQRYKSKIHQGKDILMPWTAIKYIYIHIVVIIGRRETSGAGHDTMGKHPGSQILAL